MYGDFFIDTNGNFLKIFFFQFFLHIYMRQMTQSWSLAVFLIFSNNEKYPEFLIKLIFIMGKLFK